MASKMNQSSENRTAQNAKQFSIIIPVYNGERTLQDTLRSVKQLAEVPFELIVVDDASTDGTAALAQREGATVVQHETNQGPATARNRGAEAAQNEILVFTDSDVLVPKRMLQRLSQHFRKPAVSAVQGVFSDVCPYANFFSQYKNLYNRYVLLSLPDWIDTTFTSITAVRREAFLASGGFDQNIRTASVEDRTLGRNLKKKGFKIYLDRSLEVIHNKKLTCWGFLKNQFRRSRDLIKLMLRNRSENSLPKDEDVNSLDQKGRFGTNSLHTMLRIPVAYLMLLLVGLSFIDLIFLLVVGLVGLLFFYFIAPFEWFLIRHRGLAFAAKGFVVNFVDALMSGLGIGVGLLDYYMLGKRY